MSEKKNVYTNWALFFKIHIFLILCDFFKDFILNFYLFIGSILVPKTPFSIYFMNILTLFHILLPFGNSVTVCNGGIQISDPGVSESLQ